MPEHNVLLLEAGEPESAITRIPALHSHVARLHQWGYRSTPQTRWCAARADHRCPLPSAKLLGGATASNEMLYARANRRDFDTWADDEANKAWCYEDVLPFFERSEDAHLAHAERGFHHAGGPLSVEDAADDNNATLRFLAAGATLHHPEVADYNGREQLGFAAPQLMMRHGVRSSSFGAFVEEPAGITRRRNLHVLRDNLVVGVVISPHTKEARGVKYIDPVGRVKVAMATKEVILSAGAINSAKLLMLSGVGPSEELKKHGIDCLVDLPVGKHLVDHPQVDLHFAEDLQKKEGNEMKNNLDDDLELYLKHAKGPLTQPALKALAQLKTPKAKSHSKLPDVQLALRQGYGTDGKYIISVLLNHPKSKGEVRLANADLLAHPLVDPNFYADAEGHDEGVMKEGMRMAREVAHAMHLHELPDAHCAKDNVKEAAADDKELLEEVDECLLRWRTAASGHFTGTTRMGAADAHKSVVDDKLRVHGVHNLRVVDIAVVPVTITGDPRATGIMIAEKAAELIKDAWK